MTDNLRESRLFSILVPVTLVVLVAASMLAWAESPPVREDFEIGDDLDPMVAGSGDVLGDDLQSGPDWDNLFAGDRSFRDEFDELGNPGANGFPDFLDTYGLLKLRRDGVFLFDAVSAGTAADPTVLDGQGGLTAGTVPAAHDIGNAYAYTLFNSARELVLYAGMERLAGGAGTARFEFNQDLFSIDGGAILGSRTVGDIRVDARFSADILTALDVYRWELVDAGTGQHDWVFSETLPYSPESSAEQCNAASTICGVCNGGSIDGGGWPNYDETGAVVTSLSSGSLLEFGINISAFSGLHTYANYYETRFTSMQISTYDGAATPAPQDYALEALVRASALAD